MRRAIRHQEPSCDAFTRLHVVPDPLAAKAVEGLRHLDFGTQRTRLGPRATEASQQPIAKIDVHHETLPAVRARGYRGRIDQTRATCPPTSLAHAGGQARPSARADKRLW
jgi:hypothetical protein